MNTKIEMTNEPSGRKANSQTPLETLEVDEEQVEHATPSKSVDAIRYLNNSRAFKGDDSDGHISWNVKSRIATCALMTVYVGKSFDRSYNTLRTELNIFQALSFHFTS